MFSIAMDEKIYLKIYSFNQFNHGVTVHSLRPLAGEGPGVRAVDSTTYPLTLALSPWSGRWD